MKLDLDERLELISVAREALAAVSSPHEAPWIADEIARRGLSTAADRRKLLDDIVARRLKGEPLAYVLGNAAFRGEVFQVGPGVLIPRPETEELVEAALMMIENSPASLESLLSHGLRVADLGAGSGCIGIGFFLALFADLDEYKGGADPVAAKSRLWLVERSPQAARWCRANLAKYEPRLRALQAEIQETPWSDFRETGLDMILSNPPYLTTQEYENIDAGVRDFEPLEALKANDDGTRCYREIFEIATHSLKPGGWLWFELGTVQGDWIVNYAQGLGSWNQIQLLRDMQKKPRFFVARRS